MADEDVREPTDWRAVSATGVVAAGSAGAVAAGLGVLEAGGNAPLRSTIPFNSRPTNSGERTMRRRSPFR